MSGLVHELVKRKVPGAASAYAILAWLIIQAADVVLPTFDVPVWVNQSLILTLIFGFPIIIVLAWVFDLTPQGIRLTHNDENSPQSLFRNRNFVLLLVAALLTSALLTLFVFSSTETLDLPTPAAAGANQASDRKSDAESEAIATSTAAPSAYSLAVLPLVNLSQDSTDNYFAAGMHDEILNSLSKIKTLQITPRRSVLQYMDSTATIGEIAGELQVSTIMEGSVRFSGNRVRISTQLIRASDETNLWSETYDFQMGDVFEIQSSVAQEVAKAMQASLLPEEIAQINRRPTDNTEAYTLYLQHWYRAESQNRMFSITALNPGGWISEGILELNRALELDPEFARGLAELSYSIYLKWALSPYDQTAGLLEQALDYADRAIAIDPELERAYSTLQIVAAAQRRWESWETYARRSVELPDVDGRAASNYAFSLTWLGRFAEANEWYQIAILKQPTVKLYHESAIHSRLSSGDYEIALQMADDYLATFSDQNAYDIINAFASVQLGRESDSIARIRAADTLPLTVMRVSEFLGLWNYLRCQTDAYAEIMTAIEPVNSYFSYSPAMLCAMGAGDIDKVFDLYDIQMAAGQVLPDLKAAFVPDAVRNDPRFRIAIAYMNLPD